MKNTRQLNKKLLIFTVCTTLMLLCTACLSFASKQNASAAVSPRMLSATAEHHGIIMTVTGMYVGPEDGSLHIAGTDEEHASCIIVDPATEEVLANFKIWTGGGAKPGDLYDVKLFVTATNPTRVAGQSMKLFIDFYDGSTASYTIKFSNAGTAGLNVGKLPKLVSSVGKLKQPEGDSHKNTSKYSPQTGYNIQINPISNDKLNTPEGLMRLIANLIENTIGKIIS